MLPDSNPARPASNRAAERDRVGGSIRRAGPRDLDRVAALWAEITRHHESIDSLFRMRAGGGESLRELLSGILRDPDAATFVYVVGGDLPGMCIVRIDRAAPILEEVERAEITDLGVRRDMRRRGIAAALSRAALDWVVERGVRRIEVQVAHGNREGQAFWRSQGFGDLMDVLHKRL